MCMDIPKPVTCIIDYAILLMHKVIFSLAVSIRSKLSNLLFHGIQDFVPGDFYICCKRQKPLFQVIKYFVFHDIRFCSLWYKQLFQQLGTFALLYCGIQVFTEIGVCYLIMLTKMKFLSRQEKKMLHEVKTSPLSSQLSFLFDSTWKRTRKVFYSWPLNELCCYLDLDKGFFFKFAF
jgi:hypothetical protein